MVGEINKTPFNYMGSKADMCALLLEEFPRDIRTFVDVFGGTFCVGANVDAERVVYNEMNPHVYDIARWLCTTPPDQIKNSVESIVAQYGLVDKAEIPYKQLRRDYNSNPTIEKLYVLHLYSFQHILRFNSAQEFNASIGNRGYSIDVQERIQNWRVKASIVDWYNQDYTKIDWLSYDKDTFFYFDPPYMISLAVYNDGKRGMEKSWGVKEEQELYSIIELLNQNGYRFAMSNVIEHKGNINQMLQDFVNKNSFRIIEMGTFGKRYRKKEVLIVNY